MVIVQKQSGSNTVRVAETVEAELASVRGQYPALSFGIVFDQSDFTRDAINDVQLALLLGAILAALVVFFFFRDLRNTLVTVAGLPVVVLGTFIVLHVLGISLNMISMMALSLSVGLLIDDAIVVRENIFRHMEMGPSPRRRPARVRPRSRWRPSPSRPPSSRSSYLSPSQVGWSARFCATSASPSPSRC